MSRTATVALRIEAVGSFAAKLVLAVLDLGIWLDPGFGPGASGRCQFFGPSVDGPAVCSPDGYDTLTRDLSYVDFLLTLRYVTVLGLTARSILDRRAAMWWALSGFVCAGVGGCVVQRPMDAFT